MALPKFKMMSLTDAAANRIREIMTNADKPIAAIKVVVKNGGIECPCHGNAFNLDGTVAHGPAKAPLVAQPIMVRDGQIVTT